MKTQKQRAEGTMTAKINTTYNGWTNWATWDIALWFGNDECLYRMTRRAKPWSPADCEKLVREVYPFGTPDMKRASEMKDVDWQELADAWNEE